MITNFRFRTVRLVLCTAVCLGCLLRIQGWSRSLEHDEVFTWVEYASGRVHDILTKYNAPNNHILHSLCVKLATTVGGSSEEVIRLTALTAGVLGIIVLARLGQAMVQSPAVGAWAGLLLALAPAHIQFSRQARGYTLMLLSVLVLVVCLTKAMERYRGGRKWWYGAGLSGGAAVLTIPSALYAVIGVWGWVLICGMVERQQWELEDWGHMLGAGLLTGIMIIAVYLPLLPQLEANSQTWGIPLRQEPAKLLEICAEVGRIIGPQQWQGVGWLGAFAGLILLAKRHPLVLVLCVMLVIMPFALTLAGGVGGPGRVYFYMLPVYIIALAYGSWEGAAWLSGKVNIRVALVKKVLQGGLLLPFLFSNISIPTFAAPLDLHYKEMGKLIQNKTSAGDLVIVPYIMDASVGYYAGGRLKAQVADIFAGDSLSRALFVVKRGNPRFDWGNYLLTTNFATPELDYRDHKVFFDFDTALFDTVSAFGTLGLYQGSQPLKKIWGVELDKPDNWQVYYKKRPGSLGRSQVPHGSFPDRHLLHWRTEPQDAYVVQATQRFRAPTNGVMILRYSKSAAAGSYASLFETKNENGAASPKALQMAKAITASIELSADPKARRRFGEIYLLPVKKDGVYGVFLTSQNVTEQYTGDWGVYYMPW